MFHILRFSLESIESITSKVVAGIEYKVIGKFTAKDKPVEFCTMTIWSRAWLNSNDITLKCAQEFSFPVNTSVASNRVKRQAVGAPAEISIDDESLKKKVNDGLASLAATSADSTSASETYQ